MAIHNKGLAVIHFHFIEFITQEKVWNKDEFVIFSIENDVTLA